MFCNKNKWNPQQTTKKEKRFWSWSKNPIEWHLFSFSVLFLFIYAIFLIHFLRVKWLGWEDWIQLIVGDGGEMMM